MRRHRHSTPACARPARSRLRRLCALTAALALVLAPLAGFAQEDIDQPIDEDDFSDLEAESSSADGEGFDSTRWLFDVPVDVLVLRPYAFLDTVVGGTFLAGVVPFVALFYSTPKLVDTGVRDGTWSWDWGYANEAYQRLVADPWDYVWDRPLGEF